MKKIDFSNISKDWSGSTRAERRIAQRLIAYENSPKAIRLFAKECSKLSDYWYWYMLGTLWVQYTGFSDLNLWRKLFSSSRPNRASSLMKVDELEAFEALPDTLQVYRAHRLEETDWIAYTLNNATAVRFAKERKVKVIAIYWVARSDCLCLFTRRGEWEVLVLDPSKLLSVGSFTLEYL
jgi:hypothetical protein